MNQSQLAMPRVSQLTNYLFTEGVGNSESNISRKIIEIQSTSSGSRPVIERTAGKGLRGLGISKPEQNHVVRLRS